MNQNTLITASPLKMEIKQSRGQAPFARNRPERECESHLVLPLMKSEEVTTVTEELNNMEAEV